MSELIIILIVTLLVLPPQRWPMLLFHLAKLIRWFSEIKEVLVDFCKAEIQQYELKQNQTLAEKADQHYSR